ncbi:MAG: DUF533 domain-containing protein [Polyangiaceae bacterium]
MHRENVAIIKALVSVAWADGHFGPQEKEMLDALLAAFDASEDAAKELRAYAETKRSMEDIPLEDLSPDDLRVLVQHAVLLTFIDGHQNEHEKKFVSDMASYVGLPADEAAHLIKVAEDRARKHLSLL